MTPAAFADGIDMAVDVEVGKGILACTTRMN